MQHLLKHLFLSALLVSLAPQDVWGANKCGHIYIYAHTSQGLVTPHARYTPWLIREFATDPMGKSDILLKDVLALDKVTGQVREISKELSFPSDLEIRLSPVHFGPGALTYKPYFITTGIRVKVDGEFLLAKNSAEPILAHELGHVIFYQNYSVKNPAQKRMEDYLKNTQRLQDLYAHLEKLDHEVSMARHKNEKQQIQQNIKSLETELRQLQKLTKNVPKEISRLLNIGEMYVEFFADVVAVLFKERPDAIFKPFNIKELQAEGMARHRHFQNKETLYNEDQFVHSYFSNSRSHLWQKHLSNPEVLQNKKPQILKAIFEATAAELTKTIRKKSEPDFFDPVVWGELNSSLNRQIDLDMARVLRQ